MNGRDLTENNTIFYTVNTRFRDRHQRMGAKPKVDDAITHAPQINNNQSAS